MAFKVSEKAQDIISIGVAILLGGIGIGLAILAASV